jgi:glycosyltransferase involved in cell wall biosynthesis
VPAILEFNAGINEAAAFHGAGLVWLARRIEDRTLKQADRVITVSGVLRREVIARGVAPERVVAVHNGVSTTHVHPGIDGGGFRQRHAIGAERVVVGFVGTFAPWHGVELLIEAALALVRTEPALTFLIVGGRASDERFRAARAQVEGAGAAARILLVGEIPFAEVPFAMAAMDIATIPWATDYGSPMKIFEYMAMGKALVAPDLEVLREVFRPGENALLVRRGDVEALAGAIRKLAGDPALRQALGLAARRDAVEHHDWRHHAALITELAMAARTERTRRS